MDTRHMTYREKDADGYWRTVCVCGWTSAPTKHPAIYAVCEAEKP